MQLSKTNFLQFLKCPKSLWLLKRKPSLYPHRTISNYEDKLAAEGYEVQKLVQDFLLREHNADKYSFEKVYKTDEELYASADIIRQNDDGSVNIYEVKSSGEFSKEHLTDATFQTITVEKTGVTVNSICIVHLNKQYVRRNTLNVGEMMSFSMVTEQVRSLIEETTIGIEAARALLEQSKIDETHCSCLELSKSHHCESFDYFNPTLPKPSIYNLPRINKRKIHMFINEGRFALDDIDESEVTGNQINVLVAAKTNRPVINESIIEKFYAQVKYPVYFLDYETYSSAIPAVEGVKSHAHIPFQFSLHVIPTNNASELHHYDYLADKAELPLNMIESMEKVIGSTGSIVSWHKSFENTRNKEMGILYPGKTQFLNNISERTIDLEDIFKGGYVDIAFGGSTSIKKVLPVIVPNLTYDNMEVTNGTDAMEAFTRMLDMSEGVEREKLRIDMLEYCKLDTLAMVRIFEKMETHI
jgi:CRISPR/Cas system-associated exonuclease Cas4 (RecB family)